jgi:hypothetical protein
VVREGPRPGSLVAFYDLYTGMQYARLDGFGWRWPFSAIYHVDPQWVRAHAERLERW